MAKPPDSFPSGLSPDDQEWYQFLQVMLLSLMIGLVIVMARLAIDIAILLTERRDLRAYIWPGLAVGVLVVWLPLAFVVIRKNLRTRIDEGQLATSFPVGRASVLFCLCSMTAAAVFVLTYGTFLQGQRG